MFSWLDRQCFKWVEIQTPEGDRYEIIVTRTGMALLPVLWARTLYRMARRAL